MFTTSNDSAGTQKLKNSFTTVNFSISGKNIQNCKYFIIRRNGILIKNINGLHDPMHRYIHFNMETKWFVVWNPFFNKKYYLESRSTFIVRVLVIGVECFTAAATTTKMPKVYLSHRAAIRHFMRVFNTNSLFYVCIFHMGGLVAMVTGNNIPPNFTRGCFPVSIACL